MSHFTGTGDNGQPVHQFQTDWLTDGIVVIRKETLSNEILPENVADALGMDTDWLRHTDRLCVYTKFGVKLLQL